MYTLKKKQNISGDIIYASASYAVLWKPIRTYLTHGKNSKSESGNVEPLLGLNFRLWMDHLLTPSFFIEISKETFGESG